MSLYTPMGTTDAPMCAIPTSYKGYEFRSKSEAIVARGFDLLHLPWTYEPDTWQVDGWRPDFEVVVDSLLLVMEYKPDWPTDTYLRFLISRFNRYDPSEDLFACLLIKSPYNRKPGAFLGFFNGSFVALSPAWVEVLTDKWEQAKKYRFDLR